MYRDAACGLLAASSLAYGTDTVVLLEASTPSPLPTPDPAPFLAACFGTTEPVWTFADPARAVVGVAEGGDQFRPPAADWPTPLEAVTVTTAAELLAGDPYFRADSSAE